MLSDKNFPSISWKYSNIASPASREAFEAFPSAVAMEFRLVGAMLGVLYGGSSPRRAGEGVVGSGVLGSRSPPDCICFSLTCDFCLLDVTIGFGSDLGTSLELSGVLIWLCSLSVAF